jgi:putative tricarboxylic transport membrane protein
MSSQIRSALPYAVGLGLAVLLFIYANGIQYSPREGQLGPDFWPKLAIGLMGAVCAFELIKALLGRATGARGIADILDQDGTDEDVAPSSLPLLAGGIGLTVAYAALVTVLGFVTATFLFLVAFIYLGRYRRHGLIWLSSLIGIVVIALVFLKIVYVSLPRGVPPFDRVTDLVTGLF